MWLWQTCGRSVRMNYVEANGAAIVKEINETGKLSDESREKLLELVRTYKKQVN